MSRLLFRSSRRFFLGHRWQSVLAIVGVALGVAVVVGIDLANGSAHRAFVRSTELVAGKATHQLVAPGERIGEALYLRLRTQLGIPRAAPIVEAEVAIDGDSGRSVTLMGLDPFAEPPFREHLGPVAGEEVDLARLLIEPGTVVLPRALAGRLELGVGDSFELAAAGETHRVVVAGLLSVEDSRAELIEDYLFADIATAQEIVGALGQLSRIDLILSPAQAQQLQHALPGHVELVRTTARSAALTEMTRAFEINLAALSLLALLVGVFLIYSTLSFLAVRRRPVTGMLRAVGVSRRQLFATALAEALVLGGLGTAAGLVLGIILGSGLVTLVARTIDDLYFRLSVASLALDPVILAKGAVLGLAGTAAAALAPAVESARTPPRLVLGRASLERRTRARLPLAIAAASAFAVAAWALTTAKLPLEFAFAGLFCVIAAAALLTPAATVFLMGVIRRMAGPFIGAAGRLAARGVVASLSRTGVAVAALMVAVATVIGIGTMIGSFRLGVADWLARTLQADYYLSIDTDRIPPAAQSGLVERIAAIDGVSRVTRGRRVRLPTGSGDIRLWAIDRGADPGLWLLEADDDVIPRFHAGEAVLLSEPYARKNSLAVGESVELRTRTGPERFAVAGIFRDYTTDQGRIAIHLEAYRRYWQDPILTGLGVHLAAAADEAAVGAALEAVSTSYPGLRLRSNRQLREVSLAIFDRTFTITEVLRIVAAAVAFVGLLSALQSLQLERLREVSILRAVGYAPRQVAVVVLGQTGLLGLAAGLLAIPLGLTLAALLVFVINERAFGWSMSFVVLPETLVQGLLLAIAAALLAGIYPALRMTRAVVAGGLREE